MSKTSDYLNAVHGGGSTGSPYAEMGLAQRRANEQARLNMARALDASRTPRNSFPEQGAIAGGSRGAATSSSHPVALVAALAASVLVVMPWLIATGATQALDNLIVALSVRHDLAPMLTIAIQGGVLYLLSAGLSRNHPWVALVGSCVLLVRHFGH